MKYRPIVAFAVQCTTIQLTIGPAQAATAEPQVTAIMVPHAELAPVTPPQSGMHCDTDYCGFNALQDLWKRDALKHAPPLYLNADKVVTERAQFQAQVARFGDPHATAAPEYKIPGIGICLGGYALNDNPGLHSC
jgi:hypothetical protein